MPNKYICIHGHYYQPPRENAWLETVEQQDSAHPFHNWNARVNHECYAPNSASRILDEKGAIINIVNNYTRTSFNFGPTLLSWLEQADPETYAAILEADRRSMAYFGGHGSAMAQVYGHLILPLANERDKETQVRWAIADFEHRFQRRPEGMWLSETAVDTPTLEALARNGIKFTVLAPRQAKAIRKIGADNWVPVSENGFDTRIPYRCQLPSGRSISLFFYDGRISQEVAFAGLLNNGKLLAQRLMAALDTSDTPQLSHIATDGETYGHHHRNGDMALAACLYEIERQPERYRLTNYPEFLARFPPTFEVQIHENSSWSCVHGVERWRSDCGCNTGGPHRSQAWRAPLREALNWLRDQLVPLYELEAGKLLTKPWEARNQYIQVILDRHPDNVHTFLKANFRRPDYTHDQAVQALRLLEMQRNAMLMFTSCGWFFDEVSGIETTQILQYACRAIWYAQQVVSGASDLEVEFIKRLKNAPSNIAELANGAEVYRRYVMPAAVDLNKVGMHYAVASVFEKNPEKIQLFNYTATNEVFERLRAGNHRLAIGRTTVQSRITLSEKDFSFAAYYMGQHHIIGSISTGMSREHFDRMYADIVPAFNSGNVSEVIGVMQQYFGPQKYSIRDLFKDRKRRVFQKVMEENLTDTENSFRRIYNRDYQIMTALLNDQIPLPEAYRTTVQYVLNRDLLTFFKPTSDLNPKDLERIEREFKKWGVIIEDPNAIRLAAGERLHRELQYLHTRPDDADSLRRLTRVLETLSRLNIQPDLWRSQNLYFSLARNSQMHGYLNGHQAEWNLDFTALGQHLGVKVTL